jgi:hypothetical protein
MSLHPTNNEQPGDKIMTDQTNKAALEITTKANKDSAAITTNLTIDWEGMTEGDLKELAQQALVVKLQSAWRKNGIPEGDLTVKAVDHKVGVRAPRVKLTIEQQIAQLPAEQRAALIAALQAKLSQ